MRSRKQERTPWEISRLRTLPEAQFYTSILLLCGRRSVSRVARMLLALPDRGGLQSATFETLRTYLTAPHVLLQAWLKPFHNLGPPPDFFKEAQEWQNMQKRAKLDQRRIAAADLAPNFSARGT
jgi:hypothetical protein